MLVYMVLCTKGTCLCNQSGIDAFCFFGLTEKARVGRERGTGAQGESLIAVASDWFLKEFEFMQLSHFNRFACCSYF